MQIIGYTMETKAESTESDNSNMELEHQVLLALDTFFNVTVRNIL